jgi:metal-responsive CopG/Arc/MetJ family transcriptional regulator
MSSTKAPQQTASSSPTATRPCRRTRIRKRDSLHVVIDAELAAMIGGVVAREGVSTSAIVRDALRAYFQLADPRERGWREGFTSGIAAVQRRVREAIADLERDG